MSKKNIPTKEQLEECRKLKQIYLARRGELGLNQETVGENLGISQGAVGHYLNGRNALNIKTAIGFARILKVDIDNFSPRISAQLKGIKGSSTLIEELLIQASELTDHELKELIENIAVKKKYRASL